MYSHPEQYCCLEHNVAQNVTLPQTYLCIEGTVSLNLLWHSTVNCHVAGVSKEVNAANPLEVPNCWAQDC